MAHRLAPRRLPFSSLAFAGRTWSSLPMKFHVVVLVSLSLCLGCPGQAPDTAPEETSPSPTSRAEEKTYPARQLDRAKEEAEAATNALEKRNVNIDKASATP